MKSEARKKTIRKNAANEAQARDIPAKKLEEFMKRKMEIDTKLNDQLDEHLAEFRKDLSVFIGGHLKPDPRKLEEALTDCSAQMKGILGTTAVLFLGVGDSAFKVIVYEHLVKGLELVKAISIEVNNLKDDMDGVKKQ
jgi:hypothetical protein